MVCLVSLVDNATLQDSNSGLVTDGFAGPRKGSYGAIITALHERVELA